MNYFEGKKAVLATMHGKEKVIAPILKDKVGLHIFVPETFNSDRFGTFTRDIRRPADQLETARKKAIAAMKQTEATIGIASEGSFGSHPSSPFLPFNLELVVLVDRENDLEIVGHHGTSKTNMSGTIIDSVDEALETARKWDFPSNGLIVRKGENSKRHIHKAVEDENQLTNIVQKVLSKPFAKGKAYIETDMRAHKNIKRMLAIEQATIDLAENMLSLCPACGTPGFVKKSVVSWVPCEGCGAPSKRPREYNFFCQKCPYSEKRNDLTAPEKESQMYCLRCNP